MGGERILGEEESGRERSLEKGEESKPLGRPAVSTNLDSRDHSDQPGSIHQLM